MKLKLAALLTLLASPALAQDAGERTQETVPVGEGRFLIFVGAPDGAQSGYTADMIKVEDGTPYYIPLFMEEYDPETNTAKLAYGVAFEATSYHYDKDKKSLAIRNINGPNRQDLTYALDNDILHLKTVTSQKSDCKKDCKPKQLFKAK